MVKHFAVLLFLVVATISVWAQQAEYTAPVKWETYSDHEARFSISFPKPPLRLRFPDECRNSVRFEYYAYAAEVVYKASVHMAAKGTPPIWCTDMSSFDSTDFFEGVLKNIKLPAQRSKGGLAFVNFNDRENKSLTWVIDDPTNKRLFELSVFSRENVNDLRQFVDSLATVKKTDGIDIGKGSEQILGDIIEEKNSTAKNDAPAGTDVVPLQIIVQRKAIYAEAARKSALTGTVLLKISLLANGTVGNVTVEKGWGSD